MALESKDNWGFHKLKTDMWLVQILCVRNGLYYNVMHECDRHLFLQHGDGLQSYFDREWR